MTMEPEQHGPGASGQRHGSDLVGPIPLRPIFSERVWGVETLPSWYTPPSTGQRIGEAWLTAETCVADSGPLQGTPLADLVRRKPAALGGGEQAEFPLLVKVLMPREKLSVQVHPNDAEAQARGLGSRGKTECWYVLSAEPGAQIALGFREDISTDEIRASIEDQTLEEKLRYVTLKAGDMVFVDAGTVHAIGPGLVVLETQEYSDLTFRLYDYGRPRELHVEAGLAVARSTTAAGLVAPVEMSGFTRLVRSEYFVVDRFTLVQAPPGSDAAASLGLSGQVQMLVALSDGCAVHGGGTSTALPPGWAVVLPAEGVDYSLSGAGEVIRIAQP